VIGYRNRPDGFGRWWVADGRIKLKAAVGSVVKCSREQVRGSSASEAVNRQPQRGGRSVKKKVNAELHLCWTISQEEENDNEMIKRYPFGQPDIL
jgi:hypothetical protein